MNSERHDEEVAEKVKDTQEHPEHLKDNWAWLDPQGCIELLKQVELPQEVIEENWSAFDDENDQFRFLCCKHQKLDPEFLKAHWSELEIDSKYAALLAQEVIDRELVDDFWDELSKSPEDGVVESFAQTVAEDRRPR